MLNLRNTYLRSVCSKNIFANNFVWEVLVGRRQQKVKRTLSVLHNHNHVQAALTRLSASDVCPNTLFNANIYFSLSRGNGAKWLEGKSLLKSLTGIAAAVNPIFVYSRNY